MFQGAFSGPNPQVIPDKVTNIFILIGVFQALVCVCLFVFCKSREGVGPTQP